MGIAGVLAVVSVAVGAIAALISGSQIRATKQARFAGREPLDDATFFARYCSGIDLDLAMVSALRSELAVICDVPARFIRPEDRFDEALRPADGWEGFDTTTQQQLVEIHRLLGGRAVSWAEIQTVGDLLRVAGAGSRPQGSDSHGR